MIAAACILNRSSGEDRMKTEVWTSRKRVEVVLEHGIPDRVPIDLTITELPYVRLREALGMGPEPGLKSSSFTEVRPAPEVLAALGVDLTWVKLNKPHNWRPPDPTPDGVRFDEWGVGRKKIYQRPDIYLNEVACSPLAEAGPADLGRYPWPDPLDPGWVEGLEEETRQLYETTDLALMGRFGGTILEQAAFLRGWERWLMDLVLEPDFARGLIEIITDIQVELDLAGIRTAGKYLSIFKLSGEDLGMQDRPLFSMKVWHELIRPGLTQRWKAAREALDRYAPHVKLMLHSDGAIRPFLPDLIEEGVQVLDPVQPRCAGMDFYELKRDFGDALVFHGGVDTQEVLPFGTAADVEADVLRCMDSLGKGGGLIIAPVHNVQADVPPQNLITMCRTVREQGRYPLPQRDPMPLVKVKTVKG
jgi:uroporphyrinogen decarboxylase